MKTTTLTLLLIGLIGISKLNAQWTELVPVSSASYKKIECPSSNLCVAVGDSDGLIRKTNDGGQTWLDASSGINATEWFSDFECLDDNNWVICGGQFYTTSDGGLNWVTKTLPNGNPIGKISFVSSQVGYGLSTDGFFKTIDGGGNWTEITNPMSGNNIGYHEIYFVNESVGFASIYKNTNQTAHIYKTVDGGQTWIEKYQQPGTQAVKEIVFPSINIGYGCGFDGIILKTLDNGETWDSLSNPNTTDYQALDFINETSGYFVGNSGKILKTTNGGIDWVEENHMTYFNVGVAISNLDSVYVITGGNIILRNENAGLTANIFSIEQNNVVGKIFPNPSSKNMTLELNQELKNGYVAIFDLIGNEIKTLPFIGATLEINHETISIGTYIYKIIENNKLLSTGKIVFN